MAPAQFLVVIGSPVQRETLITGLQSDGDEAFGVDSAEAALPVLQRGSFDLVILDGGLPGLSGFEVLRQIRATSDIPVILITETETLPARLAAFDLGADDVVSKPLHVAELGRRVHAILRRSRNQTSSKNDRLLGPSGIVVKTRAHSVFVGSEEIDLTPKEFAVLRTLLEHRGEVIGPDDLSRDIWGYETFGSQNFVEAHVSRLRAKLARAGVHEVIQTKRGVGYFIR